MSIVHTSEYECSLRANDFDWSKHLNNSVYLQLFESGRWDWSEKNKLNLIDSELIGLVSSIEVEYKKPIEWQPLKKVTIHTELIKMESFSVYLEQKITSDRDLHTTAKIRIVLFSTKSKTISPVKHLFKKRCN